MTHDSFLAFLSVLAVAVVLFVFGMATSAHAASDYPSAFSLWSAAELDPTDPTTQGSPHCWLPAGSTPTDTDTGVKYLCQALRTMVGYTAKDISSPLNCSARDHGAGTMLYYLGCTWSAIGAQQNPAVGSTNRLLTDLQGMVGARTSPLTGSVNDQLASLVARAGALTSPAAGSTNAQLAAQSTKLDAVVDRLGALTSPAAGSVNAQLAQLHTDLVAVKTSIDAQGPNTAGGGSTSTDPQPVELGDVDRAMFEDAQGSIHADVWALFGLLIVVLIGPRLWELWRP